jgi:HSP20 family protein
MVPTGNRRRVILSHRIETSRQLPISKKETRTSKGGLDMVEKSQMSGFWPTLYEPFRSFGTRFADWLAPASEASANGDVYTIAMELPGVEEKEVEVTVKDGVVTVKGEKKTSREEKGETWYFSERQYGSFSRSFRLPSDADEAGVKAAMKDGVLTVTVRKKASEAASSVTRVPIGRG